MFLGGGLSGCVWGSVLLLSCEHCDLLSAGPWSWSVCWPRPARRLSMPGAVHPPVCPLACPREIDALIVLHKKPTGTLLPGGASLFRPPVSRVARLLAFLLVPDLFSAAFDLL